MIGIIAPYGRTETTLAALRLADLFDASSSPVRYIAVGAHEKNVHPDWDRRVRSGRGKRLYNETQGCRAVIHFVCDSRVFKDAKLVAPNAKHVLVVSGHSLRREHAGIIDQYDLIAAPSQALTKVLIADDLVADDNKISQCHWNAGLPPLHRDAPKAHGQHVCVYCDVATIDYCGPLVICAISVLLNELRSTRFTVLSTKSWSRRDRAALHRLAAASPGRLTVAPCGNVISQAAVFADSDWVLLPGVRADFGIVADRALSCGAPVIAYDVPPFSEIVFSERGGVLVPCELIAAGGKLPVALPDLGRLLATCREALTGSSTLKALLGQDWFTAKINKTFNNWWLNTLF